MPVVTINGPDDARVTAYRDIPDPELMRTRGLFIAEGRLVVQRLVEEGRYEIESLLLSGSARRGLDASFARLDPKVPIYVCEAGDFIRITGYDIHRGCLALVRRPAPMNVDEVVRDARTLVVLESVANADNVGGVFRNAAAFGADGVLLGPTACDPLYRKAIRTSMAATLRVPFARLEMWPAALADLRALGFAIVALTPRQPALDLDEFAKARRPDRLALMVGTEGAGLSDEAEALSDYRVRIPIRPGIDSLNLAVAVGIALYRLGHG